jgi:Uma2 family endonuclease
MLKLKPRKTVEDYMKLPEGVRAELIEGELFMTPSPRYGHQDVATELVARLRALAGARGLGKVLSAPFDVHLPSGDIVQPDVVFVRTENLGIIRDWVRGVPDLLIEVLSPEAPERDRIIKRDLYARNGVPEYWIVDPAARTIEVFRLEGESYPPPAVFESGDTLTSALLPSLGLGVDEVVPAA